MIGVGPVHPAPATRRWATRAGRRTIARRTSRSPNDELTVYKVVALTRLVCPEANIPSTTALATINKAAGRELGLQRGANVVMPNLTPPEYRVLLRDLPRQGLRQRDGRDVSRLSPGTHRDDRTDPRDGARRAEAASRRLTALGSVQPP